MPNIKIEGYWRSEREPQFPKPEHSDIPFENKNKIIEKLKSVQSKQRMNHFKGVSVCRCCKQCNGSGEYSHKNWKWPEGLLHYIEVHNVKPSEQFIKKILNM